MRLCAIVAVAVFACACQRETQHVTPRQDDPVTTASPAAARSAPAKGSSPAVPEAHSLKPSYVLCESGGQLRWFISVRTIGELFDSHPTPWKMQVYVNGSPYSKYEASKAFAQGWCSLTEPYATATVKVLEDCNHSLPMPNGGCRKIAVNSRVWYTFGDAIRPAGS